MSRYADEVAALTAWFRPKLEGQTLRISAAQHHQGTDGLPEPFHGMVTEAFDEWLYNRNYELSYNQMCVAFYGAAMLEEVLTIE